MNNGLQHGALSARKMLTRRWPAPARHSRPPKAQEASRPPSVRSKEEPPTAGLYGRDLRPESSVRARQTPVCLERSPGVPLRPG